jgi:hypothetical protein
MSQKETTRLGSLRDHMSNRSYRRDDCGIENRLSPAESNDVAAAAATAATIVGGCRLWQFPGDTGFPSSST